MVAEYSLHGCCGAEAGEMVGVMETEVFSHTRILPRFRGEEKPATSSSIGTFQPTKRTIHPLSYAKSLF